MSPEDAALLRFHENHAASIRISNDTPMSDHTPAIEAAALWWKTKIIVCDKCFQATCWQGKFMCDESAGAGTVEKTIAELIGLKTGEHPDHWTTTPAAKDALPISAKDAPTPETDAAVKKMWNATINHLSDVVMGYFSRDLEQRLSASRAECEREKQDFAKAMELSVGHCNRALKLERERDAALARAHQVWQPIETAPKDGSNIIGKFGSLVFRMNWQAYNLFGPQKPEGGCEVVVQRHGWSCVDRDSCCEGFPTHWIPMPNTALQPMGTKLREWQHQRIAHEKAQGQPMFMGFPDRWYEDPTYACKNGHVSGRYLKCEEGGNVCLECGSPIFLVPPETTETSIQKNLNP